MLQIIADSSDVEVYTLFYILFNQLYGLDLAAFSFLSENLKEIIQ